MTVKEAMEQRCWECQKYLKWNGFSGYEHIARCCDLIYTLKPRVQEYDLEVSKQPLPDGVIPGTDGGLFHHPV